jgi:hypothetical protein
MIFSTRMRHALGVALIILGAASRLEAGGSLRVADLRNLPGVGDVAVAEFVDSLGLSRNVALALDFTGSRILPYRVGSNSFLIDGAPVPSCDGPRQLAIVPGGALDNVNGIVVCSGGNEAALYGYRLGGAVNLVSRSSTGGTEPLDVAVSDDGEHALVANRGSNDVSVIALDPHTGALSPIGSVPVPGSPDLVAVNPDGFVAVSSSTTNVITSFRRNRALGTLSPLGSLSLNLRATAMVFADEIGAFNKTDEVAARGRLLYVGVRSATAGIQDEIRTFRVGADGALTFIGSTPAGLFLTDLAAGYDTLFAVTVSAAGRDEVRAYRRVGTQLVLDASIETPEAPSFKQIAATPAQGNVTTLVVTAFQGGWLRSIEYTRDTVPTCAIAVDILCMNASRFEISVDWRVPSQGRAGKGFAIPLTADTGYFWFFTANNVEIVIKVVDGRAFNNFFWVFYGALSDVEYEITVTDIATGRVRRYENPQGRLASVADVTAFPGGGAATTGAGPPGLHGKGAELAREKAGEVAALLSSDLKPASPSSFTVTMDWRVPSQGTSGSGRGVVVTADTAYFWFFTSNNVEVVIKVVDGRAVNGHYWVFYGALSDVEYTIRVTDNSTGAVKTYFNPAGTLASVADTSAF